MFHRLPVLGSGLLRWKSSGRDRSGPRVSPAALAALLAAALGSAAAAADQTEDTASEWRYVTPEPGEPFDVPPLSNLALSTTRPDSLTEEVDYRGPRPWYGQLRYGTPNSTRVVVVVDERDGGEFDLYVDRNRNRIIESKDLVAGDGRIRRTPLETEVNEDDVAKRFDRTVVFRRGITGRLLGYATAGCLEGTAELDGRTVAVRRVDADGNGFFADDRDRMWLDLDGDGKWNAFTEQFPFQPVLRLADKRFAVRSDALGTRLSLEEIVGVGTFRLALDLADSGAEIAELSATLIGDDGSAVAIRGTQEAVTVPVGRYAFLSVSVTLLEADTKKPWRFDFARSGPPADDHWHAVAADQAVSADPFGELRFALEGKDLAAAVAQGATLSVSPRLYTEDGLLITSSGCGEQKYASDDHSNCAIVRLCTPGATSVLDQYQSGFA